jgi:hypothetical protein
MRPSRSRVFRPSEPIIEVSLGLGLAVKLFTALHRSVISVRPKQFMPSRAETGGAKDRGEYRKLPELLRKT